MNKIIIGLMTLLFTLQAQEVYATFNVLAKYSADLAFNASGIVQGVRKDISDEVKKGEVLAYLQSNDKKAVLEKAEIALKYAYKSYLRQKKVQKLINIETFDMFALKYESSKARLEYERAMYNKTILQAPFDGVVFYRDIDLGDTLSSVRLKTVYKIQSLHKRKLVLEFDQKYHKSVRVGDIFTYSVDGDIASYEGVITKVYPFANTNNRKILAEVEANDILVGLFGSGTISTKE